MFRGRKVTDPVVQGSASGGLEPKSSGLNRAWDTVGRAKADLRKIEQRLDQAERHPPPGHLNQTGETSIIDYGGLAWNKNQNETYQRQDEYASGAVVDNYGRSAYLKSKTNAARKVSRFDDKHLDRANKQENRQKKSKSSYSNHVSHSDRHKQQPLHLQEKNYDRPSYISGSGHRNVNDRHVEFSDRVKVRENTTENHYGYSFRDKRSHDLTPDAHSTLTDSRDIRETEINFLNNNLTQDIDADEQFRASNPVARLTHVSVTVPGSGRVNSVTSGHNSAGTQQRPKPGSHFLDMISENSNSEIDGRVSDNSQSDTESSKGRRFKADIRNIDPGVVSTYSGNVIKYSLTKSDGLAKIKETIRKQIKSSSSAKENNDDLVGATGGEPPMSLGQPTHTLHDANEPIIPRSQDLIEGSEKAHTKVRKIAAGPAAPTYKGFSEAEVRYRLVENKVPKSSDSNRKDKKRLMSLKVQEKRVEPLSSWLTVEEGEGKAKKVTRVIAPSRKGNKQQPPPKNKEIITTSSWRAGQELIMRELGPLKVRKSSRTKDTNSEGVDGHESPMEDRPEALGGEDMESLGVGSATAAEIQHHKSLSEEARRVYSDLQMDEDVPKHKSLGLEKEKRWKAPTKRKAKTSESEKQQQPSAKQRHYDQEQIRKYMQKQKAERLKRQKEEEMKHKEEEEAKKKQLEELYSKQKQATAGSGSKKERASKQRVPAQEAGQKLTDLPRHHPFHTDRPRYTVSSDSENKENIVDEDNMEISDSSSTLTGDEDELTPTGTPRRAKMDVDSPGNKKQTVNSLTREINKVSAKQRTVNTSKPSDNVPSNIKTIGDFTFDVGGVTSKFTQALQEKLNEEPTSLNSGAFNSLANQDLNRQAVSRADRIQAIKETAATLQNRLKAEAKKIQAQSANKLNENGATYNPSVRWNDLEPSRNRDDEYLSRYDRVTGAKDDYAVFRSNLPGTQPETRRSDALDSHVNQGGMSSMPMISSGNKKDIGEDTMYTDTSTFSEITQTDESDSELSHGKIGSGLKQRDYHAASKPTDKPAPLNIPRPKNVQSAPKTSNSWDDPVADDFNVFSVYSRRQQERLIRPGREPMSGPKKKAQSQSVPVEEEVRTSHTSTNQATAPASKQPASGSSQKGDLSTRRAESPYGTRSETLRTLSPSQRIKSRTGTVSSKYGEKTSSEDETMEDSYTQSFETEEKTTSRGQAVSEKLPPSHQSLPPSIKSTSKKSDRASPQPASRIDDDISQADITPQSDSPMSDTEPAGPPRLSPSSLERKFYTEFHNLESMEMSLKQLSGVERTRAVAMAQQETVSLAQMLKAKQQGYDQQMKEIQLKAQIEATEATKQLEEARKRASEAAINAADMIAKVRGDSVSAIQESTRKLIDTQTEAAKATAEAAKYLSEARARGNQDTNRLAVETASSGATSAVNTALEKKWKSTKQSGGAIPKTYSSKTSKRRSDEAGSHEDSDVGSVDEFGFHFDESMTEDELEEKSFRQILPSESHRKKGRHIHSDNESVTSEGSAPKVLDSELQSLFAGEESFDRFTDDIVKQFMKREEMRSQHQASLLRLREEALVEKTKAELQWLEQQRQRMRDKGADDAYPQIIKRQRGLKMKLQEQQAEIRKMREDHKKATKERQRQLLEKISKRKASQSQAKSGDTQVKGRLGRPNEVHTEFEISSFDEASDAEKQQKKDYKSDSEIYTEPKSSGHKAKSDVKNVEKYKKIHLDERFLTMRESKLMSRRRNAEELLKWKKKLDEEEKKVYNLEKKALKVWDKKDGQQKEKEPSAISTAISVASAASLTATKDDSETNKKDVATNGTTKESTIRTAISEAKDSTVISENISTARDESVYTSIKESIQTASSESSPEEKHRRMLNDRSNLKKAPRSGSDSSVTEEIPTQFSGDESKKLNDSSDDTMTQSYSETFDESATPTPMTQSKKTGKKSPLDNLKKLQMSSPRSSPRPLFSRSHTRNSESESEDSISHTESQSELSDFEGRIRALNEELRRRKTEADRLKRERKKKRRELMKNKEETLKKQIEAYDNKINQLKIDLHKEMSHEPAKTTVRPMIKQPKVSPPKTVKTTVTPPKMKAETDSSGPDSTQVSPIVQEDTELKKKQDVSEAQTPSAKAALEKISEGSESLTSRSEKSDPTYKEKSYSQKGSSVDEVSVAEEIEEDIASVASEVSDDKSKEMKIDLHAKEDLYDVSTVYTEEFEKTEPMTPSMTQHDKAPLSARSTRSQGSDPDTQPLSACSVTEVISENIPEHVSEAISAASGSESFVKHLDLKQNVIIEAEPYVAEQNDKDGESDNDNSISIVESSRPSSGRSERSIPSYQTEHESSESEKSPALIQDKGEDVVQDEVSEPSSAHRNKKAGGLTSGNLFDIDDLLGPPDEDDLTPIASPRSKDETPREKDTGNFFDALTDFNIRDRVTVTGTNGERCSGTLLFKGNVQFAPGIWVGVELDKPEGRHDGMEGGVRYFKCKSGHGLMVPGHDLLPAPEEQEALMGMMRSSIESTVSVNTEDGELARMIQEADENVKRFSDTPEPSPTSPVGEKDLRSRNERLADQFTDDLLVSVLQNDMDIMSDIAAKQNQKKAPPVAPKPSRQQKDKTESVLTNGNVEDLEEFLKPKPKSEQRQNKEFENTANQTVVKLMNESIDHMFAIKSNRRNLDNEQLRDSGNFTDVVEEEQQEVSASPTDELKGVLDKQDDIDHVEAPFRPGSPIPGLQSHKESHKPIEDSGNFEEEYNDELWLPPNKAPPPYPGGEHDVKPEVSIEDLRKLAEEVFYAVPHKTEEISDIVSSAVDEFWTQRRYGESLLDVQPSEKYFTQEEIGSDLSSNSRRVFKRLLFDLTGEIMRNIYKEEEHDTPAPWKKPKHKQNKYHKGAGPPTTVDVLKPAVQEAVIDILGLNGSKKPERSKWGVRNKKKDLVDNILVQELREEEPEWVNYDDDELAVKMQLTETIFENLLTDTVHIINKIYRRKQSLQQQQIGQAAK